MSFINCYEDSSRAGAYATLEFANTYYLAYRDLPAITSEYVAARSGDVVRIVVTDHQDRRPVEDILCTDEAYRIVYREAGLQTIQMFKPLAKGDEPYKWVNETRIAPWVMYVLKRAA